ncbi:MAG: hypothetical protein ACI86M_001255 [Saprospiraceae bacterium]|jgi:hypothetical protein
MKAIHDIFIWIHIPAGTLSLILFWIPVMVKKGNNIHRKVGRAYYWCMWIVQITALILSINNAIMGQYIMAAFLGFLAILTGYPLWYSYEILQQKKEWSQRYFNNRKAFAWILFCASLSMVIGAALMKFQNQGVLMLFFGLLGIPALRDARMTKQTAMQKENRIRMHMKGTIVSGIAAYTAFLSFGGRSLFGDLLTGYWQILPWIAPTIIGVTILRFMKRRYN